MVLGLWIVTPALPLQDLRLPQLVGLRGRQASTVNVDGVGSGSAMLACGVGRCPALSTEEGMHQCFLVLFHLGHRSQELLAIIFMFKMLRTAVQD